MGEGEEDGGRTGLCDRETGQLHELIDAEGATGHEFFIEFGRLGCAQCLCTDVISAGYEVDTGVERRTRSAILDMNRIDSAFKLAMLLYALS